MAGHPAAVNGLEALDVEISRFWPGAPAAGSGLEVFNVEVSRFWPWALASGRGLWGCRCRQWSRGLHGRGTNFRLGAPAAGSGLEDLSVEVASFRQWSRSFQRRNIKVLAWGSRCRSVIKMSKSKVLNMSKQLSFDLGQPLLVMVWRF